MCPEFAPNRFHVSLSHSTLVKRSHFKFTFSSRIQNWKLESKFRKDQEVMINENHSLIGAHIRQSPLDRNQVAGILVERIPVKELLELFLLLLRAQTFPADVHRLPQLSRSNAFAPRVLLIVIRLRQDIGRRRSAAAPHRPLMPRLSVVVSLRRVIQQTRQDDEKNQHGNEQAIPHRVAGPLQSSPDFIHHGRGTIIGGMMAPWHATAIVFLQRKKNFEKSWLPFLGEKWSANRANLLGAPFSVRQRDEIGAGRGKNDWWGA